MGKDRYSFYQKLKGLFILLSRKTNWKRRAFFLIFDTLLICASLYLAFWVRFEGNVPAEYFPGFYYYLALAVVIKISTLAVFKVYNFSWGLFGLREAVRLISAILTSFLVFGPVAMLLGIGLLLEGSREGFCWLILS